MKIYFRYLFIRLLIPFVVCLFAGAVIWIMADLYGNIYDFIEHKAPFRLVALVLPAGGPRHAGADPARRPCSWPRCGRC